MALKQKLAELIVDITARLEPLKGALAKARGVMKRGLDKMVRMARRAAIGIGVALIAAFAWATKAAMKQEAAEIELAKALSLTGDATQKNINRFKKHAAELQKVTTQGDETTLSLMAQLKTLGVHTDRLEEGARAYIAFQHMAMRGNTALKAAADLMKGDTSLLRSYSKELRDATTDSEKMAIAQAMVNRGFAAEMAAAETTEGALKQLWNAISDIAEVISAPFLPYLKDAVKYTTKWAEESNALISVRVKEWVDALAGALRAVKPLLEFISAHAKTVVWALGLWISLPIITFVYKLGTGLLGLSTSILATAAAAKLWNISLAKSGYTLGKVAWRAKWLVRVFARLGRVIGGVTAGFKAFWAATLLVKAATLTVFALWGLAIGLLVANIAVLIKWLRLLAKEKANARALTEKDIANYRKEHSDKIAAAKALHASAKQEVKDVEDVIAARTRLREEMAKLRKGEKNEAELKRATDALQKAVKAATPEEKEVADVATPDEEAAGIKELLEAQRNYYEKIGGYAGKLAAVKKKLREIEAKEISEAAELEVGAVRRELEAKAAAMEREAATARSKKRQGEYMEKLGMLKDLYTDAKGFDKKLASIKKKLLHEEAADIAKKTGIELNLAKAILKAKEAPVEIAKAGLVGLQAAWGQIATGTQRIDERQARSLETLVQYAQRDDERSQAAGGMQAISTPQYP